MQDRAIKQRKCRTVSAEILQEEVQIEDSRLLDSKRWRRFTHAHILMRDSGQGSRD
jgi:hypothetical protein